MKILKLTKITPDRDHQFEMKGWIDVGPMLFALSEFIVAPCELDPKVSVVSLMDRDIFVKESVAEIEGMLRASL